MNQLVWFFDDTETDCRSIQVGGLVGVFDGFREGSQALCGVKEACDCQSLVMQPTEAEAQVGCSLGECNSEWEGKLLFSE